MSSIRAFELSACGGHQRRLLGVLVGTTAAGSMIAAISFVHLSNASRFSARNSSNCSGDFGVAQRGDMIEGAVANLLWQFPFWQDANLLFCADRAASGSLAAMFSPIVLSSSWRSEPSQHLGCAYRSAHRAEPGREHKLILCARQLDCALDGFDRERRQRDQMVAFVLCSFTRDQPSGVIGLSRS